MPASIYEKPTRELMREMVRILGIEKEKTISKREIVAWFKENYPNTKQGTVTAHIRQMTTNVNRVANRPRPVVHDLFFELPNGNLRLYNSAVDPAPIYEKTFIKKDDSQMKNDLDDDLELSKEFAYENDLRNFLSKNLSIIEVGLKLYEEEEITGIEYPVGNRYIDILAVDKKNNYVVIELKVSKGYDRAVGQLLRYMGWIQKYQAEDGQSVRGIVVAKEITEDLLLASSSLNDIELFEYELSVSVRKIK